MKLIRRLLIEWLADDICALVQAALDGPEIHRIAREETERAFQKVEARRWGKD